jgi:hypothetical protein
MKKFLCLVVISSLFLTSCEKEYLLPKEWGFGDSVGRAFIPSFMKSEVGDTTNVNKDVKLITKEDCFLVKVK